ncbi:venom serine protease inhibitor isoform X2 [Apis dorsata]|uniref:venom serine protease inhibitor isoform X2 n=1 Tax=Apis dorsata TaxID=7462 RepID=UPI0003DF4927|nr:venom serine protease inhibitor isoform X2 [Apis dorsata]
MFRYISVYVLYVAIVVYIDAKVFLICGQNEKPNICGEGICPPTCCNPKIESCLLGLGPVCIWSTTGGCRCVNGTVRNENNNCVPLSECPPGICSSNE